MTLSLNDCQFQGPALPEPFVKFELEKELNKLKLLPKKTGKEGKQLQAEWEVYRRGLRALAAGGGSLRVRNHIVEPLIKHLGYAKLEDGGKVRTREDMESGGSLLVSEDGNAKLRLWTTNFNEDLYAPSKRGRAYRFSHLRSAQRVLLASGERAGLMTNGIQLVLLISDPARPDSTVTIPLDPGWKRSREVPDSFLLLLALGSPGGVAALPHLVDKARLQQARVTKELRVQARQAVERFIQEILDHPENSSWFASHADRDALAKALWHEGLITVYRLLFILKLESSDNPACSFSFASTSLWRNIFSPSVALAPYSRDVLEKGTETGKLLESGLRTLFRMFHEGLHCTELNVKPLGGALFGRDATPVLSSLTWGERAVAHLLDRLLWTPKRRGAETRERVHYGPLDVEDLGRVYEALLELEPGISSQPMSRLRRQKLEVVVPAAQGEKYRPADERLKEADAEADIDDLVEPDTEDDGEEAPTRGKKTKVEWIEAIPPDRFYLRVGLGRKASGSYYTPHSFVRFLVQETLGPQVAERSPQDDPQPLEILKLKVLDPAMGSGHFLVEACRFLGEKLYEACRLCDDKAVAADNHSEKGTEQEREVALQEAQTWRQRVIELPDPDDELLKYLPSRSPEGEESGYSQQRAEALCRRLVATHCLYGVDKNPLAVELAKLALWLESHAEGMPLTFLDHRLVVGDSLTGPFWDRLLTWPGKPQEKLDTTIYRGLETNLRERLFSALRHVRRLEASVGVTLAEVVEKEAAKEDLDQALLPFRVAAAAWSGGVMLGPEKCDDVAYAEFLQQIGITAELPPRIESEPLRQMIARGLGVETLPDDSAALTELIKSGRCVPALSYDLTFPEVFHPNGVPFGRTGFHAVLGNPPWDTITIKRKEWFANFDFGVLTASTKSDRDRIEEQLLSDPSLSALFEEYVEEFEQQKRANDMYYSHQKVQIDGDLAGRFLDLFRVFMERNAQLLGEDGLTGVVVPSAFHANEGATGVRQLYLEHMKLDSCYSFENRRQLFEIHRSFKFALVTAERKGPTKKFRCAFYLHDDEWLFSDHAGRELAIDLDFVRKTGGPYLTMPELQSAMDLKICKTGYMSRMTMKSYFAKRGIYVAVELNMTKDAFRFVPFRSNEDPRKPQNHKKHIADGDLILVEGKTFWQFDDQWGEPPRYLVPLTNLGDKRHFIAASRYYRFAFRDISGSTNERTVVFSLLPPGVVFGDTAKAPERKPQERPTCFALEVVAIANSFTFDYFGRLNAASHISLFLLEGLPVPSVHESFVAHHALRLTCNHAGYAPLWQEQLGDSWRESGRSAFSWPVLEGTDERWAVRTAIDAVVADAYGLSRSQYEHVLSTFSHASYKRAPELCLAAFDELQTIGLEAFTKKYDPYHDIPLNKSLPQPVIDLPIPVTDSSPAEGNGRQRNLFESDNEPTPQKKRTAKRKK